MSDTLIADHHVNGLRQPRSVEDAALAAATALLDQRLAQRVPVVEVRSAAAAQGMLRSLAIAIRGPNIAAEAQAG